MNEKYRLSTAEFAGRHNVRPQSVLARLCNTGSYFQIVPIRQPNGRLRWPDEPVAHSEEADSAASRRAERALAARRSRRAGVEAQAHRGVAHELAKPGACMGGDGRSAARQDGGTSPERTDDGVSPPPATDSGVDGGDAA